MLMWRAAAAAAAIVVLVVLLGPLRGSGDFPTVLDVPEEGGAAAVLDDGTPVFVIVDEDGEVRVLDARVDTGSGTVGALVGWCTTPRVFVEPRSGTLFTPAGVYDARSAWVAQPGVASGQVVRLPASGRPPAAPPSPHPERSGLRSFEAESTGPGGTVRVGDAGPRPLATGAVEEIFERDLRDLLHGLASCLPPEEQRFLPLRAELEAAALPGLITHAALASSRWNGGNGDGLALVDAVIDRDDDGPTRLCPGRATMDRRCPADADTVALVPPTGVDGVTLQVRGRWLVDRRSGAITGLSGLPTTDTDLLSELTVIEGRYRDFVVSRGSISVGLPDGEARGGRPALELLVDPQAVLLGRAALAGTEQPTSISPQQLAGRRGPPDDGPNVRLTMAGGRVVHLLELP